MSTKKRTHVSNHVLLEKISKLRANYSTEKREKKMKKLNTKAIAVIAMNAFFAIVLISGVITGNNWNLTGAKVLSALSIFLNIIFTEVILVKGE